MPEALNARRPRQARCDSKPHHPMACGIAGKGKFECEIEPDDNGGTPAPRVPRARRRPASNLRMRSRLLLQLLEASFASLTKKERPHAAFLRQHALNGILVPDPVRYLNSEILASRSLVNPLATAHRVGVSRLSRAEHG
jgi:hypothetical protein